MKKTILLISGDADKVDAVVSLMLEEVGLERSSGIVDIEVFELPVGE